MTFKVYTDGGWDMQTCIGASAIIILKGEEILYKWVKGRICRPDPEQKQKVNEQELGAIIKAVMSVPKGSHLDIYSDSQYAVNVLTGATQAYANQDLIERFVEEKQKNHVTTNIMWVKAHNGDVYNEVADTMCKEMMEEVKGHGRSIVRETENKCLVQYEEEIF